MTTQDPVEYLHHLPRPVATTFYEQQLSAPPLAALELPQLHALVGVRSENCSRDLA